MKFGKLGFFQKSAFTILLHNVMMYILMSFQDRDQTR